MKECRTCSNWQPMINGLDDHGECRAYPPDHGGPYEQRWPITLASEWCGSYQREERIVLKDNTVIVTTSAVSK